MSGVPPCPSIMKYGRWRGAREPVRCSVLNRRSAPSRVVRGPIHRRRRSGEDRGGDVSCGRPRRSLVQIAAHLVEVGHEVVVLIGPMFVSTVTSARLTFRALPPEATTDPTSKAWRGSVRGLRSAAGSGCAKPHHRVDYRRFERDCATSGSASLNGDPDAPGAR